MAVSVVEIQVAGPQGAPGNVGLEAIINAGNLVVKNNLLPPGQRINVGFTLKEIYVRVGTAPAGQDAIVRINRIRGGTTTVISTITLTQNTNIASLTGQSIGLQTGDVITYDITQVGTTTIGADMAVALVGSG